MKCLALIAAIVLFAGTSFAQKKRPVIISTKRIYMKCRQNANMDSLLIPVVSNKYPALKAALTEQVIFDDQNLKEVIKSYEEDGHGITSLAYQVNYQDAHVISITLLYETMGAYPDSYSKWLTYDIHTGKLYPLSKEISQAGSKKIFDEYKRDLRKQLITAKKDIATDKELSKEDVDAIVHTLKTSVDELKPEDVFNNYVFTTKGIMITSDGALPHATRCFELGRSWEIAWAEIRPYRTATAIVVK